MHRTWYMQAVSTQRPTAYTERLASITSACNVESDTGSYSPLIFKAWPPSRHLQIGPVPRHSGQIYGEPGPCNAGSQETSKDRPIGCESASQSQLPVRSLIVNAAASMQFSSQSMPGSFQATKPGYLHVSQWKKTGQRPRNRVINEVGDDVDRAIPSESKQTTTPTSNLFYGTFQSAVFPAA